MNIDNIIDNIINDMDKSLTKNEQMRYIYISLGKILSIDVDFFFSVDKKLEDKNYSIKELEQIYNHENSTTKIICKSSAEILKRAYDKIGLKSKLVRTINKTHVGDKDNGFDIHHHFLACQGDDNKIYFLTLSGDLGNIQMGYHTQHFANNISYTSDNGEQVYEGEEIKNSTLSFDEIRRIDEKIGYINTYYETTKKGKSYTKLDYNDKGLELLKKAYRSTFDEYKLHLVENLNNPFYKEAQKVKYKNGHPEQLNNLHKDEIKKLNLSNWKKRLSFLVNNKINSEIGNQISKAKKQRYEKFLKNGNVDLWLTEISEEVKKLNNENTSSNFNPIILTSKLNSLFDEMSKENINVKSISKNIDYISIQFIDPDLLNEKNKNLTNSYIAQKFITEMPKILDSERNTYFSNLNYAEQTNTIYTILENIFPEIRRDNIGDIENYDTNISPVKNKIITSAIKNRDNNKYSFVFDIKGSLEDDEYTFVYNPEENTIFPENLCDIAKDYIIVSSKLNPRIANIENIDEKNPQKK